MALNTGARAQLGFIKETTPGTYLAPDNFVEFVSENIAYTRPPIVSAGIRAGRRTEHASARDAYDVAGPTSFELVPETTGGLLEAIFGGVSTSGAGPTYTHTLTPGDLAKWTLQVGRPGTAGTVHPYSFTGCMAGSGSIDIASGSFPQLNINWMGQNEKLDETLATANYTPFTRWTSVQASLTIGGVAECFDDLSWTFDNALEVHHPVCATNPGQGDVRENGRRSYGGQFTSDFKNLTLYNLFKNGTKGALVITFSDGTYSLVITMNVRYDSVGVAVPGMQVLKNAVNFVAESGTSDAAAVTAVLVSTDATTS